MVGRRYRVLVRVHVGIPESNMKVQRWMKEQTGISRECANLIQGLVSMIPEWWSRCQVQMRWETPEQGSARERSSTICIRIAQYCGGQETPNRIVNAREIEGDFYNSSTTVKGTMLPIRSEILHGRYQIPGVRRQGVKRTGDGHHQSPQSNHFGG